MALKQKTFRLSDGTELIGTLVAKAAHIVIVKVKTVFYLLNKSEIESQK